jgi:hypothetical protein
MSNAQEINSLILPPTVILQQHMKLKTKQFSRSSSFLGIWKVVNQPHHGSKLSFDNLYPSLKVIQVDFPEPERLYRNKLAMIDAQINHLITWNFTDYKKYFC